MSEPKPLTSEAVAPDLRIAIVGAGMGGLACALALAEKGFRDIRVFESAPDLGFVGAGIQMAPNLVRVLTRLGCWGDVATGAIEVLGTSIRDGLSNQEFTHVDFSGIRDKYGYPHCIGHRSSLAGGLHEACTRHPAVRFSFGHALERIDSFGPRPVFTVRPRHGPACRETADVLLAADGVKSAARPQLLGQTGAAVSVQDTGRAAYRLLLPRAEMEADPEMAALLDGSQVTRWLGEGRHWIAYPVAGRTLYNMTSTQPDTSFAAAPTAAYTTTGSRDAMLRAFADFCPLVQRLLRLVPDGDVCEWKLRVHEPLATWVHGSVALVGDACHPTLPHLGQGASMAIEDAAVLAEVLARAPEPTPEAVNKCLRVYELLRKGRTTTLVELAALSGRALHLGQGETRDERDRQFAASRAEGGVVPDRWASPEVQSMIYSHDCMAEAGRRFGELYQGLSASQEPCFESVS